MCDLEGILAAQFEHHHARVTQNEINFSPVTGWMDRKPDRRNADQDAASASACGDVAFVDRPDVPILQAHCEGERNSRAE